MTYGLEVYNSRGRPILNSSDIPYTFTVMGKDFSLRWSSDGGYQIAYCDFSASPLAMVTIEWPEVEANPAANNYAHGPRLSISSLGGNNYRATIMWGWNEGRIDNPKLWVVDHATIQPTSETFGLEVRDNQGRQVFNTSTKLAKIVHAETVTVGRNTILGGDPSTQLLFIHTYYAYRRLGSLIGPWYDDVFIYTGVGWVPGRGFKASRHRVTRINSSPRGYRFEFEPAPTGYLLVDKPI